MSSAYRLVFREEGLMVNAYFAKRDTLDGAVLLLSVRRALVEMHPPLYDALKVIAGRMVERALQQPGFAKESPFAVLTKAAE